MIKKLNHCFNSERTLAVKEILFSFFFQVERGQPENINKDEVKEKMDKEEFRLREMMIKKKHKVSY